MFVKYTLQENHTIRIKVSEGSFKPYYLKAKGLKPSGVFVRQGTSSVPASPEQIRAMIKESDGDNFESMRSMEQELTFNSAKKAFDRYNVEFAPNKYRALGVTVQSDEMYSNLALVISDQCTHTTKVAVFADEANTKFRDSKEFGGSIFEQLDNTFAYLALCNKTTATFKGLERIEKVDYPEEALREALLNALVHRDYSFSGSIIINVNDKEIEFSPASPLLHQGICSNQHGDPVPDRVYTSSRTCRFAGVLPLQKPDLRFRQQLPAVRRKQSPNAHRKKKHPVQAEPHRRYHFLL